MVSGLSRAPGTWVTGSEAETARLRGKAEGHRRPEAKAQQGGYSGTERQQPAPAFLGDKHNTHLHTVYTLSQRHPPQQLFPSSALPGSWSGDQARGVFLIG